MRATPVAWNLSGNAHSPLWGEVGRLCGRGQAIASDRNPGRRSGSPRLLSTLPMRSNPILIWSGFPSVVTVLPGLNPLHVAKRCIRGPLLERNPTTSARMGAHALLASVYVQRSSPMEARGPLGLDGRTRDAQHLAARDNRIDSFQITPSTAGIATQVEFWWLKGMYS